MDPNRPDSARVVSVRMLDGVSVDNELMKGHTRWFCVLVGGHVGYHVVAPWRRQGHATRMLAAGLVECRRMDLARVLLTCGPDNVASRRVIVANGGQPDGNTAGEDCFWIKLTTEPGRS